MIQSFKSWSNINEAVTAKDRSILINPVTGQRQKIVWKLQDDSNLIVKIVRKAMDLLDANGNLTKNGVSAFTEFFNSQPEFTTRLGKIDSQFFNRKFFVYSVLHEGDIRTKIQFRIVDRSGYPEVPANVQFINTDGLTQYIEKNPELSTVATETENKVKTEVVTGEPQEIEQKGEQEAVGTTETKEEVGNKFLYTMRTNGKNYLMEFTEDGAIDASCQTDGPDGAISYISGKIMWYTDEDSLNAGRSFSKWMKGGGVPALYMDIEISNLSDKSFLTKMFTDDAFREKTIREYEEKYGTSEISEDNIRQLLYFKDGNPIFGGTPGASTQGGGQPEAEKQEASVLNILSSNLGKTE